MYGTPINNPSNQRSNSGYRPNGSNGNGANWPRSTNGNNQGGKTWTPPEIPTVTPSYRSVAIIVQVNKPSSDRDNGGYEQVVYSKEEYNYIKQLALALKEDDCVRIRLGMYHPIYNEVINNFPNDRIEVYMPFSNMEEANQYKGLPYAKVSLIGQAITLAINKDLIGKKPSAIVIFSTQTHQLLGTLPQSVFHLSNVSKVDYAVLLNDSGASSIAECNKRTGITMYGISVAETYQIPVYNTKNKDHMEQLFNGTLNNQQVSMESNDEISSDYW